MITEIRVSFKYIEVSKYRGQCWKSGLPNEIIWIKNSLNTISLYDVETISRFHVWFDCGGQNHFNSLSPSREWLAAPSNSQRLQPWILKITTCFVDTIEGCFIVLVFGKQVDFSDRCILYDAMNAIGKTEQRPVFYSQPPAAKTRIFSALENS